MYFIPYTCPCPTVGLNLTMRLNSSRCRLKERSSSALGRPEFLSLNVPQQTSRGSRKAGQNKGQQSPQTPPCESPPDTAERREAGRLPDEDCMLLNPSFRGIAVSSLLAVDICLSKCLGVCRHSSSSWGSVRSVVSLLALTGHGLTWVCGTLLCLCQSSTPAGQEVLINLLMGETPHLHTTAAFTSGLILIIVMFIFIFHLSVKVCL